MRYLQRSLSARLCGDEVNGNLSEPGVDAQCAVCVSID